MNQNEHIYFTRSKMNTIQGSHTNNDPNIGITKPIKVYSLKTKISNHKSKSNKKSKSKKHRTKLKTNSKTISKTKIDIVNNIPDTIIIKEPPYKSTSRPFSLQNLFTKINKVSNDVESEEEINHIKVKNKKTKNIYKKKRRTGVL